ncbi:DUF2621 family protein [Effusibacillus dendaii]|uniref:Uncharacterized protein n=1 Tax=Effusibacillus dendaii TaxID=2743772 RepID=A0A7I8DD72_9BACL|nr:DUF2621 family protein [Effusibacillus dendaii]BCJ88064.1 hypothetical protein skT53_30490 [Effusibacillus dendaii]
MEYSAQSKQLLEELLSPIPFFVRPMAKKMIEKKVNEIAAERGHSEIEQDDVICGYILAGENKDKDKIKQFLASKGIDVSLYQELFD